MVTFRVRDPFLPSASGELGRLRREMNGLFDSFLRGSSTATSAGVFPPVNLYEEGDSFMLTAELPGLEKENINISVQGADLILSGERKPESDGPETSRHLRERQRGGFSRVLTLPVAVDAEKVTAEYRNGVLKVVLPKAEAAKPKKVTVA